MKKPRFRRICPARLMAGIALLSVVLLQPGLVLPQPVSAQAGSGTMALVGGMLLDGYETPPIHHAAVVIEGNRIVAVGPASEVEIPAGARIVNTEGMTMLPGLVDLDASPDKAIRCSTSTSLDMSGWSSRTASGTNDRGARETPEGGQA